MSGDTGEFLEIEHKFDVGPGFRLPRFAGLPGVASVSSPQTYRLRAIYYDTAGRRLAAARITLRRRSGGPDDGWHLKFPAGADSRREIHEPLRDSDQTVPAGLAALVAGQAGGEPLQPIAELATTRTVLRLNGPDGRALAEIADDEVTGSLAAGEGPASGWREAARWREVEVELLAGSRDLLEAAGARLRDAGARPAGHGSKLARLLASG